MMTQLITAIVILLVLFTISLCLNGFLTKSWYKLNENHQTLLKDSAEIKLRSQLSFKSKIGSRATIFAMLMYGNTPLRVEIPVKLREKSHDASQYRFEIDWSALPNQVPFTDEGFKVAMRYQMNAWYHAGSNLITWISLEESRFNLSESEVYELKDLLNYSVQISEDNKMKIKRLLNI